MLDDGESEGNWDQDFDRAKDFMSGYKLKASLVPEEKRPFYEALTTLIDSAMSGDKLIAEQIAQLPEGERPSEDEGFFMSYVDYGGGTDEGFFVTSRTGWTNRNIGPQIETHRRPTGSFIRLSATNDAASSFDKSLLGNATLTSIDVYDDGRIDSVFRREPGRKVVAEDLQTLTGSLQASNADVQRRLQTLRSNNSRGSNPPY